VGELAWLDAFLLAAVCVEAEGVAKLGLIGNGGDSLAGGARTWVSLLGQSGGGSLRAAREEGSYSKVV